MKAPQLVLIFAVCSLLGACKTEFGVESPIIDKLLGHVDSPLTYCEDPMPITPIVTSGFGFNLANTRNQPSSINAANVAQLNLKYTLVDEKEEIRRGAPAATEDVLYYTGVDTVYAFNRESGCAYWSHRPDKKYGAIRSTSVLLVENSALSKRTVIVGTAHGQVMALDAKTGNAIWSAFAGNPGWLTVNGKNYTKSMITGGMQYHNGRVYVPIASHEVADAVIKPICCKTHGVLSALDAGNGNLIWQYQATADATIQDGDPKNWGPSGVSIWSTPVVDVARNQLIFGTGQNFTRPLTANSDAVVALNLDTGAENWVFKGTPEDFYNASCGVDNAPFDHCPAPSYDFDMITPILTKNPSTNADIIIAADKGGVVYSLSPVNGSKNWDRKIGAGGLLGGVHWGMAVDNNKVYAGVADFKVPKASILGSTLADLLEIYPAQVAGATPGIYALSLIDGSIAWEIHPKHSYNGAMYDSIFSAAISVTNDVLFAGSLDGVVSAFNTANGNQLWSDYTAVKTTDVQGRKGNGGAIDSVGPVIAGNQLFLNSGYSVFNIGGKNQWQGGPGNAIFVYELP